jgi:methenyltetrahydrofolate cyclohydrolase
VLRGACTARSGRFARRHDAIRKGTVQVSATPTAPLASGAISDYLEQLASSASAPGGGSVAALTAAQGAALLGMVVRLTSGKPRYAQHEAELQVILAEADQLRARCTAVIDRDASVLRALIAAYKLPRQTAEEQETRRWALQDRLREATDVPLMVLRVAAALLPLCQRLLPISNATAVSDIGVAASCAGAAYRSAELNVLINLGQLDDVDFVASVRQELAALGDHLEATVNDVLRLVRERL